MPHAPHHIFRLTFVIGGTQLHKQGTTRLGIGLPNALSVYIRDSNQQSNNIAHQQSSNVAHRQSGNIAQPWLRSLFHKLNWVDVSIPISGGPIQI